LTPGEAEEVIEIHHYRDDGRHNLRQDLYNELNTDRNGHYIKEQCQVAILWGAHMKIAQTTDTEWEL
jgi:hypothetical protein